MQNTLGELKVLVVKLILNLFWGSDSGITPHDSNDEAMKGMLMKAIRAAQGEHLPQGLTFIRPRWYFIYLFAIPNSPPCLFPFAFPLQVQGIILEMILFLLFLIKSTHCHSSQSS